MVCDRVASRVGRGSPSVWGRRAPQTRLRASGVEATLLKWLRQLIGSDGAPAPGAARQESAPEPGPLPGQKWIYVTATGCDVASAVRSIDGVLRVTREGGYWRIVADKELQIEALKELGRGNW